MEQSDTYLLLLVGGGGVLYVIALFVSIADILHQGGMPTADRMLWILLVTLVPIVGFIVYWSIAHRLARNDPTSSTARRGNRGREEHSRRGHWVARDYQEAHTERR